MLGKIQFIIRVNFTFCFSLTFVSVQPLETRITYRAHILFLLDNRGLDGSQTYSWLIMTQHMECYSFLDPLSLEPDLENRLQMQDVGVSKGSEVEISSLELGSRELRENTNILGSNGSLRVYPSAFAV